MEEIKYSENPVGDIWQKLLKYSYSSNIKKAIEIFDDSLIDTICGSIVQANEYFMSSKKASLNISPLLMYYGCVNLFYAISLIKTKEVHEIQNHGASISFPCDIKNVIGDTIINLSTSDNGAFAYFNRILDSNNRYPKSWKISDVFSFVPELVSEYNECYSDSFSSCIPIEVIKRKNDKLDRIAVNKLRFTFDKKAIVGYENEYLEPQVNKDYVILREKLNPVDVGVYSISGQKNLLIFRNEALSKYYINQAMVFFLGLFSLSVLSRYHPNIWYPFVQKDNSGEKGIVEDFLSISYRKIPNIALNTLLNKSIRFVPISDGVFDSSKDYDPEDVKRIVKDEIILSKLE
jgi:hypothetical protein